MIKPSFEILNQKGTPMFYSDVYANIPTAGIVGRMFISTDTYAFYRDTGSGWDLIGGPGTGTITGSGATGQVSFFNGATTIGGSNNLFWDSANNRLGIGTATPGVQLDIHTTGTGLSINGNTTNNAFATFQNAGTEKWRIGNNYSAGSNYFSIYDVLNTTERLKILNTGVGLYQGNLAVTTSTGVSANTFPFEVISKDPQSVAIVNTRESAIGPSYFVGRCIGGTYNAPTDQATYGAIFQSYGYRNGAYKEQGFLQFGGANATTGGGLKGNALIRLYDDTSTIQDIVKFNDTTNATFYVPIIGTTLNLSSTLTASISALSTASNSFVVSDSGTLKFRTAAQVLSDISALPLSGGTLTGTLNGTNAVFSTSVQARNFDTNGTTLYGFLLKGRASDNFGAIGCYSSDGLTRYGYIQSGSTNGGQLYIKSDGGGGIFLDSNGVLSQQIITANSFIPTSSTIPSNGMYLYAANAIGFGTNSTNRALISATGYFKASNNATYLSATGAYHEFNDNTANGYCLMVNNNSASPASTYIQDWKFTASTPNNTSARFWHCIDATATRAYMMSNGGLSNYQANNTDLSDIRTKKDIVPLDSYWNKFKEIEIVKYKYIDQTHDDYNIGVIAQQVEKIAPEFVDTDGWSKDDMNSDDPIRSIYTKDLYHATIKVLQEAMQRIEYLENKLKN